MAAIFNMMRRVVARRSGTTTFPCSVSPTNCSRFIDTSRGEGRAPSTGSSPVLPLLLDRTLPAARGVHRGRWACISGHRPGAPSGRPAPLENADREVSQAVGHVHRAEERPPERSEQGREEARGPGPFGFVFEKRKAMLKRDPLHRGAVANEGPGIG